MVRVDRPATPRRHGPDKALDLHRMTGDDLLGQGYRAVLRRRRTHPHIPHPLLPIAEQPAVAQDGRSKRVAPCDDLV